MWGTRAFAAPSTGNARLLVVRDDGGQNFIAYLTDHVKELEDALTQYGAVLFRSFSTGPETMLSAAFGALYGAALPYIYRSTPRTAAGEGVYTATEYPPSSEIVLHNENAYQRDWPMRLGFHCIKPAETGGQTTIADLSDITSKIGADIVDEFRRRGVLYVRNYNGYLDLPWQVVFQTNEKAVVEKYCDTHELIYRWITSDHLRTEQVCQGAAKHPLTGEDLWFNQAHLFHVSSLGNEVASSMLAAFPEDELPRNAYFGDGGHIDPAVLEHVRMAFAASAHDIDWMAGDVLVLDNMQTCHGRRAFKGSRRVPLSMGLPYSSFGNRPSA